MKWRIIDDLVEDECPSVATAFVVNAKGRSVQTRRTFDPISQIIHDLLDEGKGWGDSLLLLHPIIITESPARLIQMEPRETLQESKIPLFVPRRLELPTTESPELNLTHRTPNHRTKQQQTHQQSQQKDIRIQIRSFIK